MLFTKNIDRTVSLISAQAQQLFKHEEQQQSLIFSQQPDEYLQARVDQEYKYVENLPEWLEESMAKAQSNKKGKKTREQNNQDHHQQQQEQLAITNDEEELVENVTEEDPDLQLQLSSTTTSYSNTNAHQDSTQLTLFTHSEDTTQQYQYQSDYTRLKPTWHAPWKLKRVMAGHQGWVRCLSVDPTNSYFASGSNDNTIKIWDLASGTLKLTLTNHVMSVRDITFSERHPYLFSCGEDKTVKCWDLERNRVIRDYHGHLSGVYSMSLHPTLDVLVTGSRDSTLKVWDVRTSVPIFTLTGHKGAITQVKTQSADPQIISSSMDKSIRLWDLAAGKVQNILTQHKKPVRSMLIHPEEFSFASASADSIKQWAFPSGQYLQDFAPHKEHITNTISLNQDNALFAGSDDGTLSFYDWSSGLKYQDIQSTLIPGSLASEAGVLCSTFDRTGLRLITGERDKGIKVWSEDMEATEETHPLVGWNEDTWRREV